MASPPRKVGPLDWNVPIVDPGGRPTSEFQRAWELQRRLDAVIPDFSTPEQVSALFDILSDTPGRYLRRDALFWEGVTASDTVQDLLNQISTTQGVVLFRGVSTWLALSPGTSGYLLQTNGPAANPSWVAAPSGNIQTLLDTISTTQGVVLYRGATGWVALAPGAAGDVLSTNGAGADPSWVPQSGGGGGGNIRAYAQGNASPTANAAAFACKGNVFYCAANCTVLRVYAPISSVSAGTVYRCDFFPSNGLGTALTAPAVASQTITGVAANTMMIFNFSPPVSLTPGYYAVLITGTAAALGTSVNNLYLVAASTWPAYAELMSSELSNNSIGAGSASRVTAATTNPVNGTAITPTLSTQFAIHLEGTVP